ncbi:SLC13 family permease [Segatella copri]|uniref:SLC13 family permease n=1 Tax=Segatella copri TaxID=165179 RepID=A0AAW5TZH5_9BACT|nr:SLC13 family permease [Segatella copri]MCW4078251.1 SLC13 family permease [Segatella copri]MCW4094022.1 SLC13 family permease [Segatella copri]MCW4108443.1 SLC13 family permease [Segatella copri]
MTTTLIILVITVALFIWGRVRADIVALTALAALLVLGILTPAEALAGFSSPIVIMMIGLFVVGGAIMQTGLAKLAGNKLMALSRGNETITFLLVMLVTSFIGAFVSNTGTVALMMPIIMSIAAGSGMQSSRFLMPLAFAGSLGGMLTLIGTPPNLVIDEVLTEGGYQPLAFFSFFPVGIIVIAIGIIVLMPLSKIFLSKKQSGKKKKQGKSLDDLVDEYQLLDNLHRYIVPSRRPSAAIDENGEQMDIVGKTLKDLSIQKKYGVSIIEIRNEKKSRLGLVKDVSQNMAKSSSTIQVHDTLYIIGEEEKMKRFASDYGLRKMKDVKIDFYDLGLTEIVVMPTSNFAGLRIGEANLRKRFGINVLGVKRGDEYITDNLIATKLHVGDMLLVQGEWTNLAHLATDTSNWVVIDQPEKTADKVLLDYKAPVAAAIMLLMIAMMVFDFIPVAPVTAVIIAGLLTVFAGCFRNVEAAYKTINWESIVLIAAMMPMSTALEKTGASALVSQGLVESLGSMGPTALLAGIYFTTSMMTMFISNTATAVLMAPIALVAAQQVGVSPYSFLFAVTLGASMCFASPFSTPPNALVMKAGGYTFMDYVKVGLPLQIIIGVVMTFVLPLLFPY